MYRFLILLVAFGMSLGVAPQTVKVESNIREIVPQAVRRGPSTVRWIALTFDACPNHRHGGYDAEIVRILLETHTPATFFLSGRWAKTHQAETRFLGQQQLFAIGSHGYAHVHMGQLSNRAMAADLRESVHLLKALTGRSITLFRPPYAEEDLRLEQVAQGLGLTTILYDIASGDPDSTLSAARLVRVISERARSGSIIVMHVNGGGWHTAEALPALIARLRQRGFFFATLPTMLGSTAQRAKPPDPAAAGGR